jgi:2-polyprenyl-3-methyl-5-hydroxy-6-metoxy-1,4-benzoquinol methylase
VGAGGRDEICEGEQHVGVAPAEEGARVAPVAVGEGPVEHAVGGGHGHIAPAPLSSDDAMNGICGSLGNRDAVGFFDSGAAAYVDSARRQPGFIERFDLFVHQIELAQMQLGSTPTCLDLGCGPGTLALAARRRGFEVIGIDGSAVMLEYARSSALHLGLDVDFRQACLPLEDGLLQRLEGSVDLLIASSVIEYVSDDVSFASQCQSLLAPGGVGLISFANSRSVYRAVERRLAQGSLLGNSYMTVQRHQHDVSRARGLFDRLGLHTKSVHYFGMPRWLYRVWRASLRPPWLATLFLLVLSSDGCPSVHEGP